MKWKIIIFFIFIVLIICCTGCSKSYTTKEINNRLSGEEEDKHEEFFISAWYDCGNGSEIIIDKQTHVMHYYVYHGAYLLCIMQTEHLGYGRMIQNERNHYGWITPVPGVVGPMTVAMQIKNLIDSAGL